LFFGAYMMPLIAEGFYGCTHQVHGTKRMMKTGVQRTGINKVRHPQLLNVP